MTAQILGSELATILYESKKKQADLRGYADKSIQELKSLPQTSEAQIAADLRRRVQFARPFLYACGTNNPKLALPGVTCLQRLIVTKGLAPERLQETLTALQECSKINLDIQLKILQSLPSLLQNYGSHLQDELQATTIELCTNLQQVKSITVSSTAAATLQQVVSSVFDKVEHEDTREAEILTVAELDLDGDVIRVRSAAHDAFRVLQDVCLLLEGQKPKFATGATLQQPFGLELIEAILTNNGDLFDMHHELGHILRTRVMPIITKFLSERLGFSITVRTTRILCIILREHLDIVKDECEIPLTLLNHLLDSDPLTPWRRALCMETFRIIYSAPNLVVEIYALFDERKDKRNLVQEGMALFVRLASEKPSLIGVGSQSSFPLGQQIRIASQEQAVLEANSVAGIISGESGITEVASPGISVRWSSMKTPCLEQLDKTDSPVIPETYIYSLVLTCLNNLSEGAAKIVLPLTAIHVSRVGTHDKESSDADDGRHSPSRSDSSALDRRRVTNPLDLVDHPSHHLVASVAHMIDSCWPAILATSSTFLNAALDADYYRGLIRSVQRFTQVAGLLRLSTPRDAFLTTLTKSAVPAHLARNDLSVPSTPGIASPRVVSGPGDGFFSLAGLESPTALRPSSRFGPPDEGISQVMSQRNLMCLRALINLAIALGSILGESWTIIIESLQKADNVLAQSGSAMAREYRSSTHGGDRQSGDQNEVPSLTTEIAAVEAAVTRLFQSTSDYPNEAFVYVLKALFELIGDSQPPSQSRTLHFSLAKIGELARINIKRLALEENEWGWSYLSLRMSNVATSAHFDNTGRLMAADIISSIALGVCLATMNDESNIRGKVQARAIECLEAEVSALYQKLDTSASPATSVDMDVHRSAVEAVRSILENCGDSLISGWRSTFSIVESAFIQVGGGANGTAYFANGELPAPPKPISPRIAKSAFACAQLICSDFLGSLKRARVVFLIDIFAQFCSQTADINISLTTLTLFWNLSDHLQVQLRDDRTEEQSVDLSSPLNPTALHVDEKLRSAAEQGSTAATWMILLERLAAMTRDNRGDVRIGAVQTIFRIVDSSADQFDAAMWSFATRRIVFHMMEINIQAYRAFHEDDHDIKELQTLHTTTETLFKSWATTIVTQHKHIISLSSFEQLWRLFVTNLAAYLKFDDDELSTLVFDTLTRITAGFENPNSMALDLVLDLWRRAGPNISSEDGHLKRDEKSLIAYLQALEQIYPRAKSRLNAEDVKKIADNITACILVAQAPQYTSDVESMTTLQTHVLACFQLLWSELTGIRSSLIMHLASFVELPYRTQHIDDRTTLTYVAFAKSATIALQDMLPAIPGVIEVYSSGAVTDSLKSLDLAVSQRYLHFKQGKEPSLWRLAATASVKILSQILPKLESLALEPSIVDNILNETVQLASHLRETNLDTLPAIDVLIGDESFDLDILEDWRLCTRIWLPDSNHPSQPSYSILNEASLSSEARKRYVRSLFRASLLHEPDFNIPHNLMGDFMKIRPGRVWDPPFHPRVRACYASLDELFSISNTRLNPGRTSSPLAEVASPYLILRCALPLRRYIADQPLRGTMPTPMSQRLELLFVLERMKTLDMELQWLVPFVNQATACARNDAEVADALQDVMIQHLARYR